MDPKIGELARAIEGRVYPVGQLGSIVKILYGRKVLLAYVRLLRMRSEVDELAGGRAIAPGDDSRILEADLFAEGTWIEHEDRLDLNRGVETYPLPLQSVFISTALELEAIFGAAEAGVPATEISALVPIGEYVGSNGAECKANLNKLFGHHCAVLGSTGSGKSGTVAAILHSVLEHQATAGVALRPRIVLIDPHGEYSSAFGDRAVVLRAYSSAANDAPAQRLLLPYWLMSGDELRALIVGKTEAEATSQNNIIYKALKHSRMVTAGIVEKYSDNPNGEEEPTLCAGKSQADISNFDRDRPFRFAWEDFVGHIDKVQGRKKGSKDSLATSNRDKHDSILDKLSTLRTDPRLRFLMDENPETTLETALLQLTGEAPGGATLKIVDVSGAPNEVAGPLAAMLCRLLFAYKVWQTRVERERDPILLICEEAHRYVPDRGEAQYREAQDAVRRIAKEGRKYGLGLMLVSQRPADVESTVLSQCNSWLVLRLTNGSDQEHVARFLPDSLAGLTKMLSSLSRREAIFVGEAAALPARVRIRQLDPAQLPDSKDINFVAGWAQPPVGEGVVAATTARWLAQVPLGIPETALNAVTDPEADQ